MDWERVLAFNIQTKILKYIKDNSSITNTKDGEHPLTIKDNGKTEKNVDMEYMTNNTPRHMKDNGMKINFMEWESII